MLHYSTCSIPDCASPHRAKGLCNRHYLQEWSKRHPRPVRPPRTDIERFMSKMPALVNENECWIWGGAKTNGYGRFTVDGRLLMAYRWFYEYTIGPIPDGLVIDHLCNNPPCVNTRHLKPCTQRENVLRSESLTAKLATRTHCPAGHSYDSENTYTSKTGARACRECSRTRTRAWRAKLKEVQYP